MSEKRARNKVDPLQKKTKNLVYQFRMDADEAELLDLISYATDDTKADVIRKALKLYASTQKGAF